MKYSSRGEIATILTIGTFLVLGASTLISTVFLKQQTPTQKSHAAGPGNCVEYPDIPSEQTPAGYYWKADCSGSTTLASAPKKPSCASVNGIAHDVNCPNSTDPYTAGNKWCYGFGGSASPGYMNFRCMTLHRGTKPVNNQQPQPRVAQPVSPELYTACSDNMTVFFDQSNYHCTIQAPERNEGFSNKSCAMRVGIDNATTVSCQYIANSNRKVGNDWFMSFDCSRLKNNSEGYNQVAALHYSNPSCVQAWRDGKVGNWQRLDQLRVPPTGQNIEPTTPQNNQQSQPTPTTRQTQPTTRPTATPTRVPEVKETPQGATATPGQQITSCGQLTGCFQCISTFSPTLKCGWLGQVGNGQCLEGTGTGPNSCPSQEGKPWYFTYSPSRNINKTGCSTMNSANACKAAAEAPTATPVPQTGGGSNGPGGVPTTCKSCIATSGNIWFGNATSGRCATNAKQNSCPSGSDSKEVHFWTCPDSDKRNDIPRNTVIEPQYRNLYPGHLDSDGKPTVSKLILDQDLTNACKGGGGGSNLCESNNGKCYESGGEPGSKVCGGSDKHLSQYSCPGNERCCKQNATPSTSTTISGTVTINGARGDKIIVYAGDNNNVWIKNEYPSNTYTGNTLSWMLNERQGVVAGKTYKVHADLHQGNLKKSSNEITNVSPGRNDLKLTIDNTQSGPQPQQPQSTCRTDYLGVQQCPADPDRKLSFDCYVGTGYGRYTGKAYTTFDCGNTAGASCKNYKCMTLDDALRNDGKKDGKTYTGNCGEPSKVCMATDQYADRMGWVDNKKFRFNIKNTCAIGKTINITVVNNDNVKNGIDHGKNVQYAYSDGQIKTGDFSFENNFRFEKWDKTNGIHREIKISVEETIYTEKDINGNQSVKRINYIPDIIIDIIPIDNTTTNVDINTGGC